MLWVSIYPIHRLNSFFQTLLHSNILKFTPFKANQWDITGIGMSLKAGTDFMRACCQASCSLWRLHSSLTADGVGVWRVGSFLVWTCCLWESSAAVRWNWREWRPEGEGRSSLQGVPTVRLSSGAAAEATGMIPLVESEYPKEMLGLQFLHWKSAVAAAEALIAILLPWKRLICK